MHVADVLTGADSDGVRRRGHDQLSVYGILRDMPRVQVVNVIHQLLDRGLLTRTAGDRPVIGLSAEGLAMMRHGGELLLRQPVAARKAKRAAVEVKSWSGVDRELFEHLRDVRRRLALERGVPPYVIFDDATLREFARVRPTTLEMIAGIRGVGEKKLADLGPVFLSAIAEASASRP
jgi:ATP-dependent DNA helicase RecQ